MRICGSRRGQEGGGGAGPSREPKRDQELGGGAGLGKLDNLLLQLFLNSCSTDITFVTLLSTAVETAVRASSAQVASHWRGPHLLKIVVLAVTDGLFGLRGSECADELLTCSSPSHASFPVPNKPHGFCGR